MVMTALTESQAPLPATASKRNTQLALVGGALGLFSLGALATALVLEGPGRADATAAPVAVKTEKVAAGPVAPVVAGSTPLDTRPAAASLDCDTCGIVEMVTPVQRKGEATGLGAVAGGVLGGVVGHQIGGGNGRKAMTLLGAVGGGLAGNEIEKRQRSTTAYQLKIRMADGSTRSLTQAQALAVGQHVHFDGQHVTPMAVDAAPGGARGPETSSRSS
jgi:outer membrane lipoprotein SlyB